jgi:hypothetical protein
MPIMECEEDGKKGYKWGESGKCYTYESNDRTSQEQAKEKAKKQGAAIKTNTTTETEPTGNTNKTTRTSEKGEWIDTNKVYPIVFNTDLEALRLADFNEGTINMASMSVEELEDKRRYDVVDAVAAIGDKFYGNIYVPAETLKASIEQWNGTYNDLSHLGTMYPAGMSFVENIDYITGYNSNAFYDDSINGIRLKMHINQDAPKYKSWKNLVDIANDAGKIPNVSIFGFSKFERKPISSLPSNAKIPIGVSSNGTIISMASIVPFAVTTCLRGKCNDSEGCGISSRFSEPNKMFAYTCDGKLCDIENKETDLGSTKEDVVDESEKINKIKEAILKEEIKEQKLKFLNGEIKNE